MYEVRDTESEPVTVPLIEAGLVMVAVFDAVFEAGPVILPESVPLPVIGPVVDAATGAGRAVGVPSTWICPPVALAGISIV